MHLYNYKTNLIEEADGYLVMSRKGRCFMCIVFVLIRIALEKPFDGY